MVPAGMVIGALIDRSIGNNRVMVGPAVGKHKAGSWRQFGSNEAAKASLKAGPSTVGIYISTVSFAGAIRSSTNVFHS